jgi:hypothetical protein
MYGNIHLQLRLHGIGPAVNLSGYRRIIWIALYVSAPAQCDPATLRQEDLFVYHLKPLRISKAVFAATFPEYRKLFCSGLIKGIPDRPGKIP